MNEEELAAWQGSIVEESNAVPVLEALERWRDRNELAVLAMGEGDTDKVSDIILECSAMMAALKSRGIGGFGPEVDGTAARANAALADHHRRNGDTVQADQAESESRYYAAKAGPAYSQPRKRASQHAQQRSITLSNRSPQVKIPTQPWVEMSTPSPSADEVDPGPGHLDMLAAQIQVDDHWITRSPAELHWWGADIPLRIAVSPARTCHGDVTVKVSSTIRVVENIRQSDELVHLVLRTMNSHAGGHSWWFDPVDRALIGTTTHYAHRGNRALLDTQVFATLLLMAYAEGLFNAEKWAEWLDGEVAVRPHPVSGHRTDVDEMLDVVATLVRPNGLMPSKWSEADFVQASEYLFSHGSMSVADGGGLSAEFPFTSYTPVLLKSMEDAPEPGMTSLVTQSPQEPHVVYGNGLRQVLRLPSRWPADDVLVLANGLNRAEAIELTSFPSWGAWLPDPRDPESLIHVSFYPNMVHRPGLTLTVAGYDGTRSAWASERLANVTWT